MKRSAIGILVVLLLSLSSQAQQIRTYTSNDEDSIACITALSLYIEFFKQENYADAMNGWRQATAICPRSTESIWINGTKLYTELIDKEQDETKKDKLIDTLEWCYDQRIKYFGNEGYVLGRKGSDMVKYRSSKPKEAFDVLSKSFELQKMEMEAGALIYYYKSAYDMYRKKMADKSLLFDIYGPCSDVVDQNKAGTYGAQYVKAQENIDKMFSTVAECPDLVEIYGPKFQATPKDEKLLRQILKLFDKRDCTNEDLYQKAAVNLYDIDPSSDAAYAIANGYAKKENYSEALNFYQKAADQATDNEMKVKALTKAGNTALLVKQFAKARSIANDILKVNPNSGDAYIMIGDSYMGGRKECGGLNECEDRAAFWAAYDKYARAKSVDDSVAEEANKRMSTAKEQFPKKEDCFFYGKNEGSSYSVGCWIGESTTVRTRD
ncbi:MAG: hypothetical protein R2813_06765 [Flavobacteriales bacterium]